MSVSTDTQKAVRAFLSDAETHGCAGPVEVIETHISVVFLAGDRAYKLKRAVDLPYADFSTPELRLFTCGKELELNRSTAPDLYLGVRRITRTDQGNLEFDGGGPLVDAVVEMVRFDQEALLDRFAVSGRLTPDLMDGLAGTIADVHAAAPIIHATSGSENLTGVLDINRAGFGTSHAFGEEEVEAFDKVFRRRLKRHARQLDEREAAGQVRRCHGDLHLRNICMINGRPTLFDCIDFSDQIATVDVLYDLAFLLMDLWHRDLGVLGNLTANRYFDAIGDDAGYELLPFFMAVRAAVRAHVTATFAEGAGKDAGHQRRVARGYFDLALDFLHEEPARIVAIGGRSGSGKTTIAEALAPQVGPPPGARIVESDRTRKAMFGVPFESALPQEAYQAEVSDEVYRLLGVRSRALADAGACVVADAVFDREDRRTAFEASVAGVPMAGYWLSADPATLRRRVKGRVGGPSDANVAVLEQQLARDLGKLGWKEVSSTAPVQDVVATLLDKASGVK